MPMDDIFDRVDKVLEDAKENGYDVDTEEDTTVSSPNDYLSEEKQPDSPDSESEDNENPQGKYEDEEDDYEEDDEEAILKHQKKLDSQWEQLSKDGETDLTKEEYVSQESNCTEEEYKTREKILDGLIADIAEIDNVYNRIDEDMLAEIAGLSDNAQAQLAEDINSGKVKVEYLTHPFVLGYQDGAESQEEDKPAEENPEPSAEPEPVNSSYTPADEDDELFAEDEINNDYRSDITMADYNAETTTENVQETNSENAAADTRRGFMSVQDFQTMFETFDNAKALLSETAGSAVTAADYENMMNDVQDIISIVTGMTNYYLQNALYPFTFENSNTAE